MKLLNKIISILVVLCLFGCETADYDNHEIENDIEYIEPMKEVLIYSELNKNLQKTIDNANGEMEYQNYQFKMMFKDIYTNDLLDIFGNVINLSEYPKLVFEVSSITCNHCKQIAKEYLDNYLEYAKDAKFVQYFDDGDIEDIKKFYDDLEIDIPSNITIIPKSDEMHEYVRKQVGMQYFPTLSFFLDGKLRYSTVGIMEPYKFNNACNLGFVNPIKQEDLVDKDGNSLLASDRSIEDVKNSFSKENIAKIENLSSDLYTAELTYKLVGKKCNFDDRLSGSPLYISEIDNYDEYKDKKVVLLYTLLETVDDKAKIDTLNELIASNNDVTYIVVFIESYSSSSNMYKKMNYKIQGAKIVSILGSMPKDFYNYGIVAFPSAVFIDKSTFVGAYSKISDVESFNYAIDLFLSDNSIAYVKNN